VQHDCVECISSACWQCIQECLPIAHLRKVHICHPLRRQSMYDDAESQHAAPEVGEPFMDGNDEGDSEGHQRGEEEEHRPCRHCSKDNESASTMDAHEQAPDTIDAHEQAPDSQQGTPWAAHITHADTHRRIEIRRQHCAHHRHG
jgi:hypothetical protein